MTFNLFNKDPQRYVPVNNGNCPVAQLDRRATQPGDPRYGVLYQGRLFLCASDADRKRFLQEPVRYAAIDVAENGFCPHCLAENGLLVRGDPRYDLSREGRRIGSRIPPTAMLSYPPRPNRRQPHGNDALSRHPEARLPWSTKGVILGLLGQGLQKATAKPRSAIVFGAAGVTPKL